MLVEDMTYQEWAAQKSAENATVWETYTRKGRNLSADTKQWEEYKAVLGRKVPNTIAGFQDLKYNEPEKWESLKNNEAPDCVCQKRALHIDAEEIYGIFSQAGR